ncbi:MAG: hypothetical protein V3U87_15415 [Methylococcaceae bacterium]
MININDGLPPEATRLIYSNYANQMTVQLFDVHPRFPYSQTLIPNPLATGVLAQYNNEYIIITASHVLDSQDVEKYGMYIGGINSFIDLGEFSFVRTSYNNSRVVDDDVDIAVIILETEVVKKIHLSGYIFTKSIAAKTEGENDFSYPCAHFIHGFPINLTSKRDQHYEPVSLSCFLPVYDGTKSNWASKFNDKHIDFEYFPKEKVGLDGKDLSLNLPEPHGYSGCGVWRVPLSSEYSENSEGITMVLVGIIHRFNRSINVLRSTNLDALHELIKHR